MVVPPVTIAVFPFPSSALPLCSLCCPVCVSCCCVPLANIKDLDDFVVGVGAGAELVNNELCLASGAFFKIFTSEWLALTK